MIDNILNNNIVIGFKQCKKAASEGRIKILYVALDADKKITAEVVDTAKNSGADIIAVETMSELGNACKIDVGASLVAVLK